MTRILVLGALLVFSPLAHAQTADPLFSRMLGHWQGQGTRLSPISGHQLTVQADVVATIEELNGKTALLSQNQITETDSSVTPPSVKTYVRNYWILPVDGQPGQYELGAQGSTQPSSSGVLGSDGVFRVEQDLGGGANPYVDRSQTEFDSDRTVYSDTFSIGNEVQSRTQIEYLRTESGTE
jgi:hypothetical protein